VKNKEVKKWHQAVASAVMEAGKSPIRLPLKRAKLRLTRFSTVRPDTDGLVSGFKAVIDGLVKAGVLFNDKYENIGFPEYLWDKAPPKAGRLQVVVIPVPEEQEELPI
jgi:Holliday junction resolvase RusA-like endonuclease